VLKNIRNVLKEYVWFLICSFALILITHLTTDRLDAIVSLWIPNISEVMNRKYLFNQVFPNLKGMFFLLTFVVLFLPVVRDIYVVWPVSSESHKQTRSIILAIIVFVILFILHPQFGLRDFGEDYSQIALNPFMQTVGWHNTRLLLPAIAYIFFFRGYWLYYVFFVILTIAFIYALHSWFARTGSLAAWEFLSICTSSFVYFQFQFPGYTDILIFIFFLFVIQDEVSQKSKLFMLVLSLFVHEASFFIGLILAWRFLDRKHGLLYVLVLAMYFLTWMAISSGGLQSIVVSHDVNNLSGIDWLIQSPIFELMGIFISYKILWLIVFWAVVQAYRSRMYRDIIYISGLFGMGLLMTILAVDTSRLFGFTFPMIFLSLKILENKPMTQFERKLCRLSFFLIYSCHLPLYA
jgi:hypothetical protein